MDPKAWRLVPPDPDHHTDFENLCRDVLAARLRRVLVRHGRSGQAQHGVDCVADLADGICGFQFKCVHRLTLDDIEAEVLKADAFPVPLADYHVLASIDRDARLQEQVLALSQARQSRGGFPVQLIPWPEIRDWLVEHPSVVKAYYPLLFATVPDVLEGHQRRISRAHPGVTVEVHAVPGRVVYTIHPGTTPVQISGTIHGAEAVENFKAAVREGTEVTFSSGEFDFPIPDALAEMVRPGLPSSLTLRPSAVGAEEPVTLVVERASAVDTFEQFERRILRGPPVGFAATKRIVRAGTDVGAFEIVPHALPMALSVTCRTGSATAQSVLHRRYAGVSVHAAAAVEELFSRVAAGAYIGIVGSEYRFCMRPDPCEYDPGFGMAIALLVELADATGWNLQLSESLSEDELGLAAELLDLFRDGRRVMGRGGTLECPVTTEEDRRALLALMRDGIPPHVFRLSFTTDFTLLGHSGSFQVEQTLPIVVDDALCTRIETGSLPFKATVRLDPEVESVETLIRAEAE